MSIVEWSVGPQALTPTQSHWFSPGLSRDDTGVIALIPYTTQYGNGTAPWTVTLTTIAIDANGHASAPIPIATYATGFDFQTAAAAMPNNQTAVFWTVANGTYPASHLVDLDARMVDASGRPTGGSTTLLSGINNLEQFRVGSGATAGSPTLVAYSTYDATTQQEQVRLAGFNADGTPVPADSRVLDTFTSYGYDAFGFGTLTPSTGASPGFIYLRDVLNGTTVNLVYQTIGTNGAPTGALTPIKLSYDPGSANQTLVNWAWDRLDGPASGNNLVTAAIISDVLPSGATSLALDVRVLNTKGGAAADDVVPLNSPGRDLALTRLADGGFVVGYVDGAVISLRQYDNAGDLTNTQTVFSPTAPAAISLDTLPDGRIVLASSTSDGRSAVEDVFTALPYQVMYRVDAGVTRAIALHDNDSLTVKSGGTVTSLTATSGAQGINILSGGRVRAAVLSGGSEQVFGGAIVDNTTLNGPVSQNVVVGGVARGTIINAFGIQSSAGETDNTIVNLDGYQDVAQLGHDYGTLVNTGGAQVLDGYASRTAIAGGVQLITGSGQAVNAVITAGNQAINSGGAAYQTTVNGGIQDVGLDGQAVRTVINGGGTLSVHDGGVALSPTVNAGGLLHVWNGGRLGASGTTATLALNGGSLVFSGGTTSIGGAVVGSGTGSVVEVQSGTLELGGTVSGPLALQADAGTRLILDHGAAAGAAFSFSGAATLQLNEVASFSGSIAHLGAGNAVDLRAIADTAGHLPTLAYAAGSGGGTLSVTSSGQTAKLALVGSYASSSFHLASDSHGGTLVSYG